MKKKSAILWYENLPENVRNILYYDFKKEYDEEHRDFQFYKWIQSFDKEIRKVYELLGENGESEYVLKTNEELLEQISDFGDGYTEFHTRDIERLIRENIKFKKMIITKKLMIVESLNDIEKDDLVIITGELLNNQPFKVEMVKVTETDGTQIILDMKQNRFFSLDMYLIGKSWVKECYVLK